MFAYCRNNPVKRKDASGNEDVCVTDFNEDDNPLNDLGNPTGSGSGGNGGKPASGGNGNGNGANGNVASGSGGGGKRVYSPPPGGGGVSSQAKVGDVTVEFGHGGRHLGDADISEIESRIAEDVVTRPPTSGHAKSAYLDYHGAWLYYSYFTRSPLLINVGTYYFTNALI